MKVTNSLYCTRCNIIVELGHVCQPESTVESASTSPQGAGEQWKPDCDIEAMRNALSKLESQVCRNPDLPEVYKTILRDGFKAVGNIELRLKAGAQGAVPGPQEIKVYAAYDFIGKKKEKKFREFRCKIGDEDFALNFGFLRISELPMLEELLKKAATPEPHSPPIKCGKPAASLIPRWGMSWACALEKGHEGECQPGGTCVKHGPYISPANTNPQCPKWPDCIPGCTPVEGPEKSHRKTE